MTDSTVLASPPWVAGSAAKTLPAFSPRTALDAKRAELIAHIAAMRRSGLEIEHASEQMESVVNMTARDQRAGEIRRTVNLLAQVNSALARLNLGLYSECCGCSEPIAEKRLKALPWAALCAACATEREIEAARA